MARKPAARPPLDGKTVVVGVGGSIAAYKAAEVVSQLVQRGARVPVVMTKAATNFVGPLTFQTITRIRVMVDQFDPESVIDATHISLTEKADLVLVAPATANLIAKATHGLADDLLSTALLATRAPLLLAPAMNVAMWEHGAVRENVRILRERGVRFVDPEEGELADGEYGMGRMASLDAIVGAMRQILGDPVVRRPVSPPLVGTSTAKSPSPDSKLLLGRTIVITAGGTEEPIDPVRIITNRSSGKMGFALAEEARAMGAAVKLITARTTAPHPVGIPRLEALTADAMAAAVREAMPGADALIMAAAVSDFTPAQPSSSKMKRREGGMTLDLQSTPDILASMRDVRCRESVETIRAALVGNYQPEHIFALAQALALYDSYQARINDCDVQIEQTLELLIVDKAQPQETKQ